MGNNLHNIYFKDLLSGTETQPDMDFRLAGNEKLREYYSSSDSFIFNGFVISLNESGRRVIQINGKDYEIGDNAVTLVGPNNLIKFHGTRQKKENKSIIISAEAIIGMPSPADVDIMEICTKSPVLHISQEHMQLLQKYYSFLDESRPMSENMYRGSIRKAILYAMIMEICGIFREMAKTGKIQDIPRHDRLHDEFFRLLARNYRRERRVSFYADKLCLTPKYLSKAIRLSTGKPILQWINEAVIVEIKVQLKTTDKSIMQISEDLNFPNPSAFVQYFKLHTGTTPLKFRKSGWNV